MQRIVIVTLLALVAGSAVNAQNVDCSPSIGEYATLANFTILAELLDAAGLYGALNNTPFTAFAPTDDTFLFTLTTLNIPPEKLTAPEFLPVLTTVLTYHNLTSKPTTEVTTIAGLPLTLNYTTGTYAEGASSPLTIGAVESSASVDLKNAISIPECGVYVYPINSVMLPRGGAAALAALGSGPLAPAAAPAAAAISG